VAFQTIVRAKARGHRKAEVVTIAQQLISRYNLNEPALREGFEAMFRDRNLTRHRFGTYSNPQVASLWNQHIRTAVWVLCIAAKPLINER
jgi:hypothetical protein